MIAAFTPISPGSPSGRRRFMNLLRALALFALTFSVFQNPALAVTWQTIDVPGATLTALKGINASGDIIGAYDDNTGAFAFVMRGGVVTNIVAPNSLVTNVSAINNNGDIAGSYEGFSDKVDHGFILQAGSFTTVDYPGAAITEITGINNLGDIVGSYTDFSSKTHAFQRIAGTFSTIDEPNARLTTPSGINDAGDISATAEFGNVYRAFVLSHGHHIRIHPPNAAQTHAYGLNNLKQVVGYFADFTTFQILGFESFNKMYLVIDQPGPGSNLVASGINDNGDIVGTYTDSNKVEHGFLRTP
jgi:probable HAF family extracellular repeat protein